jgi:phage replication-related protein YjqB (UPF0714/DUF867 family)
MADKYNNFAELQRDVPPGDYAITFQESNSGVLLIAPHGGGIEPGTVELAQAIAGTEYSYYTFDAKRASNNDELHITSTHFDDPVALRLASSSQRVVAVHGCKGDDETVYLGGLDTELIGKVARALADANIPSNDHPRSGLLGRDANNICNRGSTGKGVQLELSEGLRSSMFLNLKRKGRETRTQAFFDFVDAIRTSFT